MENLNAGHGDWLTRSGTMRTGTRSTGKRRTGIFQAAIKPDGNAVLVRGIAKLSILSETVFSAGSNRKGLVFLSEFSVIFGMVF